MVMAIAPTRTRVAMTAITTMIQTGSSSEEVVGGWVAVESGGVMGVTGAWGLERGEG